ncbi:MAG TPA: DUF4266 domain-containing protein [Kofleriaceae bacterium]|nr:DUF4266 domain-containing protein [Kofleriaceae bacterium]
MHRWRQILLLGAAAAAAGGCVRVKPWQREQLARPAMQTEMPERERAFDRVIDKAGYEGQMGGGTTEGSGCGCN